MQVPKFCYISPILSSLHWLPVKYRIDFKIILTTFKAIHGLQPKHLLYQNSHILSITLTTVSDQITYFCSRPLNVKLFPCWVTECLQLPLHASGTLYPKLLETLMISLHLNDWLKLFCIYIYCIIFLNFGDIYSLNISMIY